MLRARRVATDGTPHVLNALVLAVACGCMEVVEGVRESRLQNDGCFQMPPMGASCLACVCCMGVSSYTPNQDAWEKTRPTHAASTPRCVHCQYCLAGVCRLLLPWPPFWLQSNNKHMAGLDMNLLMIWESLPPRFHTTHTHSSAKGQAIRPAGLP